MARKPFLAGVFAGLTAALALATVAHAQSKPAPTTPLGDSDRVTCWQSNAAKDCTAANLADYVNRHLSAPFVVATLGSPAAHGVMIGNGGANPTTVALGSGQLLVGQGASANPAAETLSGDCTLSVLGAITCTKSNGSLLGSAAFQNTGTSGAAVPLLNGANIWGAEQAVPASTTSGAGLKIPEGVAPTTPVNGEVWTTSGGMFVQIEGSTVQLATTTGPVTTFNGRNGAVTLNSSDVTTALGFTPLSTSGTAAAATKLATARGIATSGDVTCPSTNFDGTASITLTSCALATSGVTAATYGDAGHVAQVTVDGKGRVTGASSVALQSATTSTAGVSPLHGVLFLQQQETSGTASPDSLLGGSWVARTETTAPVNTISGATWSGTQFTLPSGTYQVRASAVAYATTGIWTRIRLRNATDVSTLVLGPLCETGGSANMSLVPSLLGTFTLSSTKTLQLEQYVNASTNGGQSAPGGTGDTEVYVSIEITKIG